MLGRGMYWKILLIVAISALLSTAISSKAYAKLAYVELAELVEKAAYIAYGNTVKEYGKSEEETSGYIVLFKPNIVLKNTQDEKKDFVPLCNDVNDIESYDLRLGDDPYFVFATREGRCLMPVWGINSVISVNEDIVYASNIEDQPEKQEVNDFMNKIKALVEAENKK